MNRSRRLCTFAATCALLLSVVACDWGGGQAHIRTPTNPSAKVVPPQFDHLVVLSGATKVGGVIYTVVDGHWHERYTFPILPGAMAVQSTNVVVTRPFDFLAEDQLDLVTADSPAREHLYDGVAETPRFVGPATLAFSTKPTADTYAIDVGPLHGPFRALVTSTAPLVAPTAAGGLLYALADPGGRGQVQMIHGHGLHNVAGMALAGGTYLCGSPSGALAVGNPTRGIVRTAQGRLIPFAGGAPLAWSTDGTELLTNSGGLLQIRSGTDPSVVEATAVPPGLRIVDAAFVRSVPNLGPQDGKG